MATTADAELILKLYDLRREGVCREARKFFVSFNPESPADAKDLATNFARPENAFVRQATSYWEMAFSIANTGAIHEELFAKNCGEGVLFAVKCQHLKQKFPDAWNRTMAEAETFIAHNAIAKQKMEIFKKRFA